MSSELPYTKVLPSGGFDFSNSLRNNALEKNGGITIPNKNIKTGTTIVGIKFKVSNSNRNNHSRAQDGVCLAADTRATGGDIVGDKVCQKIHYLAPNIYCCGAGTAADCDHVTGKFSLNFADRLTNFFRNGEKRT